ncbi:hypothetical protein HBH82_169090 [Parastagonospora nodorum]|nr:hypothetical protein HBH50_186430 [Parastagonospora nodorum]KAH4079728.1 hypothetical protein HBH48_217780 [Parastagonospora nodorum]KAH4601815.1 hypothetical protein HBH82_169090 [Parastagonospora nodorum]KAH4679449.1 hypothetical protein HBH78_138940 [Parastagonospora nodorum]KAH4696236.1 hypothetical protein HBH67_191470 [Parastagonospora nodorum]
MPSRRIRVRWASEALAKPKAGSKAVKLLSAASTGGSEYFVRRRVSVYAYTVANGGKCCPLTLWRRPIQRNARQPKRAPRVQANAK